MEPGAEGALRLIRAIAEVTLLGALVAISATPALARATTKPSPSPVYPPGSLPVGADVSYPQCGHALPVGQAFGIVGVNGGRASTVNPCLARELAWAANRSTEATSQPAVSVYLNTGDPGSSYLGQEVPDWPNAGGTAVGQCLPADRYGHLPGPGQVSTGCAYEYGYQRAVLDIGWLSLAAAKANVTQSIRSLPVWLDVETSNTWLTSTALNLADLQGMVAALRHAGVRRLGLYAVPAQWLEITGGTQGTAAGSLLALPTWLLGAGSLAQAESDCQATPLSGGEVEITQFPLPTVDGDYAC